MSRAVVWFRRDLRLADHPALIHALDSADEVLPLDKIAQRIRCILGVPQATPSV